MWFPCLTSLGDSKLGLVYIDRANVYPTSRGSGSVVERLFLREIGGSSPLRGEIALSPITRDDT